MSVNFAVLMALPLRFLILGLLYCAMVGYGLAFLRRDRKDLLTALSIGTIVTIFIWRVLGLLDLYSPSVAWIFISVGLALLFICRGSFFNNCKRAFIATWKNRFPLLLLAPVVLLMTVRMSAPPNHFDNIKCYYALCLQYIHAGGIRILPNDFFMMSLSPYFFEPLFLVGMLLYDDIVSNLIFLGYSVLFLVQIARILENVGAGRSKWFAIFAFAGCGTFFHITVFGKVDVVQMYFLAELLRRAWRFEGTKDAFYLGLLGCFMFFMKYTFLMLIPMLGPALIYGMLVQGQLTKKVFIYGLAGIFIPICFFILQNVVIMKMPLFPFIYNSKNVPLAFGKDFFSDRFHGKESSENFKNRLIRDARHAFLSETPQNHFKPLLFTWIMLISLIFPAHQNKKLYWVLISIGIWNWFTFEFFISECRDRYRYSFLGFIFIILAASISLADINRRKARIFLTTLAAISVLTLLATEGRYLPGIRFHLGQQDLQGFYRTLGDTFANAAMAPDILNLRCDGRIAVFGLSKYYVKNINADYVELPLAIDGDAIKSKEDFIERLNEGNYEFVIVETWYNDRPFRLCESNATWIESAIKCGDLIIVKNVPKFLLLRNVRWVNADPL